MQMLHYLKKLDRTKAKREYYEKLYREKGILAKKQYGSLCWKRDGPALKDYYAQKPF